METFNKAGLILAALVLTTGMASASPADLNLFQESSSTRIDSFTSYELNVENTGPTKDVYTLSSSSTSEITIAPQQVELETGASEAVNVWYNPDTGKDEGEYSFQLTATSRATGDSYSTTGLAEVIKDHQVDIEVANSRTACLGENAVYTVDVTNTGIQSEEFSLSSDFGQFSRSDLNLEDGETAEVTLEMSSDSPVERNFNIVAASKTSYAQDIENVQFNAVTCYDSEMSVTPGNQEVAAQTGAEFDISIDNLGTRDDTFTLSTSQGELSDTEIEVASGATETATLTVTPEELGSQTVEITSSGNSDSTQSVNLDVYNGMSSTVSFAESRRAICEDGETEFEATVTNDGEAEETFNLSSSMGELETSELSLEPGDSEEVEVAVNSSAGVGQHDVSLTSTASTFGEPSVSQTSTLTVENCWDLDMQVTPEVTSAGENRSAIYRINLNNTGTEENTYELSHEGPDWIEVRPEEVTVGAGETGTAYLYAGIPFQKQGEVEITANAEGTEVERSQTVRLLIGEEIEDAIESGENNLGSGFGDAITGAFTNMEGNTGKIGISVVAGVLITSVLLYFF